MPFSTSLFTGVKVVFALFIFMLGGCGGEAPGDVVTIGNIAGQVLDAATNEPLQGVSIATSPATQSVTTDANGEFHIDGAAIGAYSVAASKAGYISSTRTIYVDAGVTATASISLGSATGSISGLITDALTGLAVMGASIATDPVGSSATADEKGRFALLELNPGDYNLVISANGYVSVKRTLTVAAGKVTSSNLVLTPSIGEIGGFVTDAATGKGIAGASLATEPETQSVTTDADGYYFIPDVPPGTLTIHAAKSDYVTATKNIVVNAGIQSAASFVLASQAGSISGIITDESNSQPIRGATVATDPATQTTTTDAAGLFTLTNVPAESYNVLVSAPNYVSASKSIIVSSAKKSLADFTLSHSNGSISGIVTSSQTGAPLVGVAIMTIPATSTQLTDATGAFTVQDVAIGSYEVKANLSGYVQGSSTVNVGSGSPTAANFSLLPSFGSISGILVNATTGNPIAGASIVTEPTTSSVFTASDGSYSITRIIPNSYTIKASKAGFAEGSAIVQVNAGQAIIANFTAEPIVPKLSVSPSVLDFGSVSTVLQVTLGNRTGSGVLTYSLSTPAGDTWLGLSSNGGQISDNSAAIQVSVVRTGLAPGNYSSNLAITSNGGTAMVPIILTVPNPDNPQATVSRSNVNFGDQSTSETVTLSNTGTGVLSYTVSDDAKWLSVSPASGTVSGTPQQLTLTVSRADMTVGSNYSATVSITSNGGNQNVSVSLAVSSAELAAVTLEESASTTSTINLGWSQVSNTADFGSYKIYRAPTAHFTQAQGVLLSTKTSYADRSFTDAAVAGTTQFYKVYACNKGGVCTPSNEISHAFPEPLKTWTKLPGSPTTMTDIWALDDDHAWACGGNAIYSWDPVQNVWSSMALPAGPTAVGRVQFLSASEGYAAASNSSTLYILKYNGISWSIHKQFATSNYGITDLQVWHADTIWIGDKGSNSGSLIGRIWSVKKDAWTEQGINANEFAFKSRTEGYAAGSYNGYGTLFKFNGIGWSQYTSTTDAFDPQVDGQGNLYYGDKGESSIYAEATDSYIEKGYSSLTTYWPSSSNGVWINDGSNDSIYYWNGSAYVSCYSTTSLAVKRFFFHTPRSGWAVTDEGIFMYR